jgi:hypothetical protein
MTKEEHFLTGHERLVREMRGEFAGIPYDPETWGQVDATHRLRHPSFLKLALRIWWARRRGYEVRVQARISGSWMYVWGRR